MFYRASSFNQDISGWDTSSGTKFRSMFYDTSAFNQELCSWGSHYSSSKDYFDMFVGSSCPITSHPTSAIGPWCICCGYGQGSYTVYENDEERISGGAFGNSELQSFGSCPPTLPTQFESFSASSNYDYDDIDIYDIATDGKFAALSAPYVSTNGVVFIYERNGNSWSLVDEVSVSSTSGGSTQHFGTSIALSGDTLLVGAYGTGSAGAPFVGSAHVFVRQDSGFWTLEANLTASDYGGGGNRLGEDLYFGRKVALIDNTAVIGATGYVQVGSSGYRSNCGAAYVFNRNGTAWTESKKLVPNDCLLSSTLHRVAGAWTKRMTNDWTISQVPEVSLWFGITSLYMFSSTVGVCHDQTGQSMPEFLKAGLYSNNTDGENACFDFCSRYMDLSGFAGFQWNDVDLEAAYPGSCLCYFDAGSMPSQIQNQLELDDWTYHNTGFGPLVGNGLSGRSCHNFLGTVSKSTRNRIGTSLEGVCEPATGSYPSAWKVDVTSYGNCRRACEAEILPLNTDNVFRGFSLHTVDGVPRCSCQFDNPTGASVNVPVTGWVASNRQTGSGPVVKHNGEVGAKCFPVVDCVEEATSLPNNSNDPDICYDYCLPYMHLPGFAGYQYSSQKGICECHFDNGQLPPRGSLPPGSSVNDQGGGAGPIIGRNFAVLNQTDTSESAKQCYNFVGYTVESLTSRSTTRSLFKVAFATMTFSDMNTVAAQHQHSTETYKDPVVTRRARYILGQELAAFPALTPA
ncbi:hypothetical protein THAOC_17864, partial [Thalassiosira oceanica]